MPNLHETESVDVTEKNEETELLPETQQTELTESPEQVEEELETAAGEDRVFGMPRLSFQLSVVGLGLGYIAAGLLGMAFGYEGSALIPGVVGGVIGYLVSTMILKKRAAAQDDASEPHDEAQ